MDFNKELNSKADEIQEIIKRFLPEEKGYQSTVISAMNYSILAGGKRLRPMLMAETGSLFSDGCKEIMEPFMAAIEMIHTYSLVHDDLPSMDNDEYRRGRKTTHIVYGEGMAVLAGDALLNYAFETAVRAFESDKECKFEKRIVRALSILAQKAGIYGMIGGQTADIEAENMGSEVTKEQLLFIHKNKTAALIESAMMIGAVLGGASDEDIVKIEKCAYNIGIAFQIQDDILDITSSLEVLGKQAGSDEKNKKTTYVTLNGIMQAKEDVESLSEEAIRIIDSFSVKNEFLNELILKLVTREK